MLVKQSIYIYKYINKYTVKKLLFNFQILSDFNNET